MLHSSQFHVYFNSYRQTDGILIGLLYAAMQTAAPCGVYSSSCLVTVNDRQKLCHCMFARPAVAYPIAYV